MGRRTGVRQALTPAADSNRVAAGAAIVADVEKATAQVADAEQSLKAARSALEIDKAQARLLQAQQVLEIAKSQMELHKSNLWMVGLQKVVSAKGHDDAKSLQDRMASLEKETLGDEATQAAALKWGDRPNVSRRGMGWCFSILVESV